MKAHGVISVDYMEIEMCMNLNPNSMNFIVLQLNVRSVLAHQSDLKNLLNDLDKRNSKVDILLLSETFLTKKMEKLVNIDGYTVHAQSTNDMEHVF